MQDTSPSRSYITLADPYGQEIMKQDFLKRGYAEDLIPKEMKKLLEQNLKAAAILQDEIVFRASAVLKSKTTNSVIKEAGILIEKGILIPEVRRNDESLEKQLNQNPSIFGLSRGDIREAMPIAEILDNAKNKIAVDAPALSLSRSYMLIDHLFRQKIFEARLASPYLKRNVAWSQLEQIFDILCSDSPVDRSLFIDKIKNIYRRPIQAELLIQDIYFGLGASIIKANPIWTNHLAPTAGLWKYPKLKLKDLKGAVLKIANRFGVSTRLEEIGEIASQISAPVRPDKMASIAGINSFVLDNLSWHEIVELREKRESIKFRKVISQIKPDEQTSNYADTYCEKLNKEFMNQSFKMQRRNNIVDKINLTLGTLGVATVFFPLINTILSLFGLGVSVFDETVLKKNDTTPLISFSQLVKMKAAT